MNTTDQSIGSHGADAPVSNAMNAIRPSAACCGPAMSNPKMTSGGISRFVPAWLGGSRGIMLGIVAVVGAGLAFGWPAVVALGIAPIVLSLLPCAAMCALGMCAMGKGRQTAPPAGISFQSSTGDQSAALASAGSRIPPLSLSLGDAERDPVRLS